MHTSLVCFAPLWSGSWSGRRFRTTSTLNEKDNCFFAHFAICRMDLWKLGAFFVPPPRLSFGLLRYKTLFLTPRLLYWGGAIDPTCINIGRLERTEINLMQFIRAVRSIDTPFFLAANLELLSRYFAVGWFLEVKFLTDITEPAFSRWMISHLQTRTCLFSEEIFAIHVIISIRALMVILAYKKKSAHLWP